MSTAQQTADHLRDLRLKAMAAAYEGQLDQPRLHDIPFDDRLAMLVDAEINARESRKLKSLVSGAAMPEPASLEDVDYRPARELDKSTIASLATCEWIRRQQNLIIHGKTGAGKTWLACAVGHQACRQKLSVSFYRASDLYDAISLAGHDGSMPKVRLALTKPALLILDDFGIGEISPSVAQVLLDIVDKRMRSKSLLVTSQYPTDEWHGFFSDPTIADAILDRIVHQAHRIRIKGESMRKLRAQGDHWKA